MEEQSSSSSIASARCCRSATSTRRRPFAQRLELLRNEGAPRGRFHGVDPVESPVLEHVPGKSLRARLSVPRQAAFFDDHFPRSPVFPATLLLDAQIRAAAQLVAQARGPRFVSPVATKMTHVKMRSFITPGQEVVIGAELGRRRLRRSRA